MSSFEGTEDFGGSDYPSEGYVPDPQFKVKSGGAPAHRPSVADLSRTVSEKDNPLNIESFSKVYPFTDEPVKLPDGHTPKDNLTDKDTNPKDAIGANKLPLSLVPETLVMYASLGFLEGALKYGRYNWRIAGVRSSIYIDALKRHIAAYESGEDMSENAVPHLSNALACLGIIIDAKVCGKLIDDRPPKSPMTPEIIRLLSEDVIRLKEKFKDHHPHQYTIEDSPRTEPPPCWNLEKFDDTKDNYTTSLGKYMEEHGVIIPFPKPFDKEGGL